MHYLSEPLQKSATGAAGGFSKGPLGKIWQIKSIFFSPIAPTTTDFNIESTSRCLCCMLDLDSLLSLRFQHFYDGNDDCYFE